MKEREKKISMWFEMWLKKDCNGVDNLFSEDIVYIESYGPKYEGIQKIQHWFKEYNSRREVVEWNIKQYFHKDDQTVVEWVFTDKLKDGEAVSFDGMTLVKWTVDNKIHFLKEFGCDSNNYDPYQNREEADITK